MALGWRIKKTSILARVADALNAMLQSGPSDCRARAQLVRDGAPQLLLKLLSNVRVEGGAADTDATLELVAQGDIRPVVDSTRPLQEAAAAHAYLEQGTAAGKVVLQVAS